jgi:Protein of unknown function (DUF3723)
MSISLRSDQVKVDASQKALWSNKYKNYKGAAKVEISVLDWDIDTPFDPAKVARLEGIFSIEGCLWLDPRNHISAVIETADLKEALKISKLDELDLKLCRDGFPPELKFPDGYRLQCLEGIHRIRAAEKIPDKVPGQKPKWWVINLYDKCK